MWACWQKIYPAPAAAPWQDQKFSFVDENGDMQTEPVSKFLDTAALGYVYDNVDHCARGRAPAVVAQAVSAPAAQSLEQRFPVVVASAQSVAISQATTTVDVAVPRAAMLAPRTPTAPITSQLVLRNITAQSPPGVLLKVYVENKGKPAQRQYVGTISWFNAFGHHNRGSDVRTLTFDVSDQLRTLGSAAGTAGLTVTFEATTGLSASGSTGAAAPRTAAAQAFRPEAGVRIGTIEFRQAQ
jgi:hypothetical protein